MVLHESVTSAGATSDAAAMSSVTSTSSDDAEAVPSLASVDVWPACSMASLLSIIMAFQGSFIAIWLRFYRIEMHSTRAQPAVSHQAVWSL